MPEYSAKEIKKILPYLHMTNYGGVAVFCNIQLSGPPTCENLCWQLDQVHFTYDHDEHYNLDKLKTENPLFPCSECPRFMLSNIPKERIMKPKVHNSNLSAEVIRKSDEIDPVIEAEMGEFSQKAFRIKPKIVRYSETLWYAYYPSWFSSPNDLLMEIRLIDSNREMNYYEGLPQGL